MTTFVLIPGAGGVAWYWHRLVPELEARGHAAIPVDLPGDAPDAGLGEYVELVVAAAQGRGDVTVVAQSLGGFTAPLVCDLLPVRQLILLNAMIAAPGESPGEWWGNTGHVLAEDFDVDTHFLHDVPAEVLAGAYDSARDESDAVFAKPWPLPAWPDVPTRVLASDDDRFFSPSFQARVARDRLGITPERLPGGHLVALSRPAELAALICAPHPHPAAAAPHPHPVAAG